MTIDARRLHRTTDGIALALLATLALGTAGCDLLQTNPGDDFAVALATKGTLHVSGRITAPVRFTVTGCPAFDASVQTAGADPHAIHPVAQADGAYLAEVPVSWLHDEDPSCVESAGHTLPSSAELTVTCRDAGRRASVEIPVLYSTALRAYFFDAWMGGSSDAWFLYPSPDPLHPYALSPSLLQNSGVLDPLGFVNLALDGHRFLLNPLDRPRLAVDGSRAFLSAGCYDFAYCPGFALSTDPSVFTPGEQLYGVGMDATGSMTGTRWDQLFVPWGVLDLAFLDDGSLVALSVVYDVIASSRGTAVTRVVPAAAGGGGDVQVLAFFPGESHQTRLSRRADGALVFAALVLPPAGPIASVLHVTDGLTVTSQAAPTGAFDLGTVPVPLDSAPATIQLSPDATAMVVSGRALGPPGATPLALPTTTFFPGNDYTGGAVWLDGAVALWWGVGLFEGRHQGAPVGRVEVFEPTPPHPLRFVHQVERLPADHADPQLVGVTSVGNRLVLTTTTGVRILGPDGTIVGGAEPLPCGLSPTAAAIRTGPTTAAVAAGQYVYVFDVR